MLTGILISYILGAFFNWTNLSLALSFFPILSAMLISVAPDSPKWLISVGKGEQAFQILENINGTSTAKVIAESMTSSLASSSTANSPSMSSILRNTATIKSILVCLGVISVQQLSG